MKSLSDLNDISRRSGDFRLHGAIFNHRRECNIESGYHQYLLRESFRMEAKIAEDVRLSSASAD